MEFHDWKLKNNTIIKTVIYMVIIALKLV